MPDSIIPIFIGYDYRERAATNVLIDSLYQKSSAPLSITPLVNAQLIKKKYYFRNRDPKQSSDFSFTRFLVPFLMDFNGWAIFMDCDMLCESDIKHLWDLKDDKYSVMCVKHEHNPTEKFKFLGEVQTAYPKKNWSSLMLFNCAACTHLSIEYVNTASGLDLHRFNWLDDEKKIGEIPSSWNHLILDKSKPNSSIDICHWTLGGPWFKEQRDPLGILDSKWFKARDDSIQLWD